MERIYTKQKKKKIFLHKEIKKEKNRTHLNIVLECDWQHIHTIQAYNFSNSVIIFFLNYIDEHDV